MSNPISFTYSPNEIYEEKSKIPGETNKTNGKTLSSTSPSHSQENSASSRTASEMEKNSKENAVKRADTDHPKVDGNTKVPAATNAKDEKTDTVEREILQDHSTRPASATASSGELPNSTTTPAASKTTQTPVAPNAGQVPGEPGSSQSKAPACGLVFVQRVSRLPVVQCTAGVYRQAKASQALAGPLGLLELCAWACARPLQMAAAPLGDVCAAPLRAADWLLCRGLDATQVVFPCLNVHPAQMCGTTVNCVQDCICCCPRTILSTTKSICTK